MDSVFIFTTPVLHLPPLINISVPPVPLGMPWLLVITNAGRTGLYLQTAVQTKGWLVSINTMRYIFFININIFLQRILFFSSLTSSSFLCPNGLTRIHQSPPLVIYQ